MKNHDHVVWNLKESKLECLHCKQWYLVSMPIPISLLSAISNEWIKSHKNCKKADE